MEPENSQIWIFSRHFLRSWCPFYLCYVFQIHFGSDHLMNIAPTSLSGIVRILGSKITGRRFCCAPELSPPGCALFQFHLQFPRRRNLRLRELGFEVTLGRFLLRSKAPIRGHISLSPIHPVPSPDLSVSLTPSSPQKPSIPTFCFEHSVTFVKRKGKERYYNCKYKHAPVWKMNLTHVFWPPFTIGQKISLIVFEGQ